MKTTELRLYFLVMYNLSGIQKGIQAGHAALEYARKHADDPEFQDFVDNHKTFIVLDGGSSRSMAGHLDEIQTLGIKYAEFREPDLNDSISAIAFILPKTIYAANENSTVEERLIHSFISPFHLARN